MPVRPHRVLLGVSAGISAYKAPILVRLLRARDVDVRVVMTESAKQFVTPLSLQAVSNQPVLSDLWTADDPNGMDHIALAKWADQVIIAPATANCIARMAQGLADDLLMTLCLATPAPVYIAPAMNQQMWAHAATQSNLALLQERGIIVIGPDAGEQACGDVGLGRMSEPEAIVGALRTNRYALEGLQGKRILITAGPTQEALDPIRFLTNRSTGVMGYALAACARDAGADVTLISGPVNADPLPGVRFVSVTSAESMHQAVFDHIDNQDMVVATAAVADYTPAKVSREKIKKSDGSLSLELERTRDILADIMALPNPPFCVGFSAETDNVLENSEAKRQRKGVPVLVANQVGEHQGFGSGEVSVTVLSDQEQKTLTASSKEALAPMLWKLVIENMQ